MSPWGASAAATALLLAPWALMPRRTPPEIRGVVRFLWWLNAGYCALWHRLPALDRDPLPERGPVILISNHTCCVDHMILQASTRRALGFLIARELYEFWVFRPFCALIGCIPVKRDGRDLAATRAALRMLEQGRVVPIFPEGRITPASGRVLGEAKPGVAFLALHAKVPVIPAYIYGTPETRLVVPSLRTPSNARVVFGPPVDLSDLLASGRVERDQLGEATDRLMGAIRALRDRVQGDAPARAGRPGEADGEGSGDGRRPQRGALAVPGRRPALG